MSSGMFIGDGQRAQTLITLKMEDLYNLFKRAIEYQDMPKSDKDAVAQNFCCLIEKHIGTYPNVPRLVESFAEHPVSITEIKSEKTQKGRDWTPRDALIDVLRKLDSAQVKPESLVVAYLDRSVDGTVFYKYSASAPDFNQTIGLMQGVTLRIWSDSE